MLGDLVSRRAKELTKEHGNFASPHEVYGVLVEELDEFFEVVRKPETLRSTTKMVRELVDIASAALRAAEQFSESLEYTPTEKEILNA